MFNLQMLQSKIVTQLSLKNNFSASIINEFNHIFRLHRRLLMIARLYCLTTTPNYNTLS